MTIPKKQTSKSKKNLLKETPTPFVKWVGGKRTIISELVSKLPNKINDYYEPFVGGGALFFEINKKTKNCYLSDVNSDLVIAYNVIKENPKKLIESLKKHHKKHSEEHYYRVRSQHELQDSVEIASRFLYLNKTCYNGLYRVNKKDQFNVSLGKYKNPNIIQEENIKLCNKVLKNTIIECKDFQDINPKQDDFVYFDPPYYPISITSFTNYSKLGFTEKDQLRLRNFAVELTKRGVNIMLSNSYSSFIMNLYKDKIFKIKLLEAPRFVNSNLTKRGNVKEILITNF